ncbi:MAG: hypothetical protein JWN72_2191 [Thermoleophilia bacterium]|nr:hypothetical protein [Thermoleophilia bacterium]
MDELTHHRGAVDQARFRDMNQLIKRRVDEFLGSTGNSYLFMCECSLESCEAMITLGEGDYAGVRSGANRFLVLPDHVDPLAERVLERHATFWTIELGRDAGHGAYDR